MSSVQRQENSRRWLVLTIAAMVVLASNALPLAPQQMPPRTDTIPLRADYRNLDELLQKIPKVAPPAFDKGRALWISALPLACLDRLQSRPGARGGGARGTAGEDTAAARGAAIDAGDSAGRGVGTRGGAAGSSGNSGGGYFWVSSYSLMPDHDRYRAFWGCTDWHSAVSSTWVTVRLLKSFPDSSLKDLAREKLNAHLGKSNLEGELAFFKAAVAAINPIPSANQSGGLFERPYGFAWLLKLQCELQTWPDSQGKQWAANVAPLASWMADDFARYIEGLPEPVRAGTQANTALSMTLALDYAYTAGNTSLRKTLVTAARKFYLTDKGCSTQSEPVGPAVGGRGGRGTGGGRGAGREGNAESAARGAGAVNDLTAAAAGRGGTAGTGAGGPGGGQEILSPCLSEAALMARVLAPDAFATWVDAFLPPMQSGLFAPLTEPISAAAPIDAAAAPAGAPAPGASAAAASERARLSVLSFERAQAMERIARGLPAGDPRVAAWHRLSALHADRGFELMRDDTAGTYWVPAHALLYLTVRK